VLGRQREPDLDHLFERFRVREPARVLGSESDLGRQLEGYPFRVRVVAGGEHHGGRCAATGRREVLGADRVEAFHDLRAGEQPHEVVGRARRGPEPVHRVDDDPAVERWQGRDRVRDGVPAEREHDDVGSVHRRRRIAGAAARRRDRRLGLRAVGVADAVRDFVADGAERRPEPAPDVAGPQDRDPHRCLPTAREERLSAKHGDPGRPCAA
jgi:hypothetical protein